MMILFAIAIAIAIAALLFGPWFKGRRTLILGWLVTAGGSILPLATEIAGYLQGLDWRAYVLDENPHNRLVLAITAGLGITIIVLRYLTTGPVGAPK